jgi:hypothetical protein
MYNLIGPALIVYTRFRPQAPVDGYI